MPLARFSFGAIFQAGAIFGLTLGMLLVSSTKTDAQAIRAGLLRAQADAAKTMILVGVQQGISALPPSSSQSFLYKFDFESEAFEPSDRLGPIALRSPEVLGKGQLNLRVGTSYFELDDHFGPIDYRFEPQEGASEEIFTKFGLAASARVALVNWAASYGITDRLEVRVNIPVVVVDAKGSQQFFVFPFDAETPPADAIIAFAVTPEDFNRAISDGQVISRQATFKALGFGSFSQGTNAGLGRVSIGGKVLAYRHERFKIAFESDLFLPSPNEDEFAGAASFALFPRIVAAVEATNWLRFYLDGGYDHDFDKDVLRRFVWDAGISAPFGRVVFDFGIGGSEYLEAIKWTPDVAAVEDPDSPGEFVKVPGENNQLGTSLFSLLFGFKARLSKGLVIGGTVSVPIDGEQFRPDAIGTLAAELAF